MTIQSFSSDQFQWKKTYGFTGLAKKVNLVGDKNLSDRISIKSTRTGKIKHFHKYSETKVGNKTISVTYMPNPEIPNRNSEEVISNIFGQGIEIVISM